MEAKSLVSVAVLAAAALSGYLVSQSNAPSEEFLESQPGSGSNLMLVERAADVGLRKPLSSGAQEEGQPESNGGPLDAAVSEHGASATAWLPAPGSPLSLLDPDEAAKYRPTLTSLAAWVRSVEALEEIDASAIVWTEEVEQLWGLCQEHLALRRAIIEHQDRERSRWAKREQSISLEVELSPVRNFMDRQLGYDQEVWTLISSYSDEVAAQIRKEGEGASGKNDASSRWVLHRALSEAGAPAFDAVVDSLKRQP